MLQHHCTEPPSLLLVHADPYVSKHYAGIIIQVIHFHGLVFAFAIAFIIIIFRLKLLIIAIIIDAL